MEDTVAQFPCLTNQIMRNRKTQHYCKYTKISTHVERSKTKKYNHNHIYNFIERNIIPNIPELIVNWKTVCLISNLQRVRVFIERLNCMMAFLN